MSKIRHEPSAPTQTAMRRAGERVDRHRHDDHQLIHVSAGVIAITTDDATWVASPERALWVPAGTAHEHRFYGTSAFHTVGFPAGPDDFTLGSDPVVVGVSALLREIIGATTEPGLSEHEYAHLRVVLHDRLRRAGSGSVRLPNARNRQLAAACRLVEDELATPRSVGWLAARVGVSERSLSRLFRNEFGMTYPQWRLQLRLFHALVALAEGRTVTQTAHDCGWATPSAFVDAFSRSMGSTPGRYRPA